MSLVGCSGITTPDPNEVGGDFYICENLLKGYYAALSNRNYTQALSYCKPGGVMYKFANSMWDLALDYPELYHTYQIYNVYNFSHPTSYFLLHSMIYTVEHTVPSIITVLQLRLKKLMENGKYPEGQKLLCFKN